MHNKRRMPRQQTTKQALTVANRQRAYRVRQPDEKTGEQKSTSHPTITGKQSD